MSQRLSFMSILSEKIEIPDVFSNLDKLVKYFGTHFLTLNEGASVEEHEKCVRMHMSLLKYIHEDVVKAFDLLKNQGFDIHWLEIGDVKDDITDQILRDNL